MSRDVAQRDLDQAGFRIANLGEPENDGDATFVDPETIPRPNRGTGSPGESKLAAAADHVHPETGEGARRSVHIIDPSQQAMTGKSEEVLAEFTCDFEGLAPKAIASFGGLVKVSAGTGRFRLRIGGAPGEPDGSLVAEFTSTARSFEKNGADEAQFNTPEGPALVKVTAVTDREDGVASMRAKSIEIVAIGSS